MTENNNTEYDHMSYLDLVPNTIAIIIDNEVVEIMRLDDKFAAILLSNPTIVDVTGENKVDLASVGDIYDPVTKTFSSPNQTKE